MLNAKLKPVWSDEERGADRYRLLIEASADVAEAGTQAVSIHDLSATGFLLESDASLPVGAEISLDIPGAGTGAGDVVWTSGRFAGGQFRKPLASEVLAGGPRGEPGYMARFRAPHGSGPDGRGCDYRNSWGGGRYGA
jgi:hypothetical protein